MYPYLTQYIKDIKPGISANFAARLIFDVIFVKSPNLPMPKEMIIEVIEKIIGKVKSGMDGT